MTRCRWRVTRCERRPRPVLLITQALPPIAGADRGVRTADCGRRSAVIVGSADWQQTDFFIQRSSRDVAVTMNSVKILHAVRSAITAIAELLVTQRKSLSNQTDRQNCCMSRNEICAGKSWARKSLPLTSSGKYVITIITHISKLIFSFTCHLFSRCHYCYRYNNISYST